MCSPSPIHNRPEDSVPVPKVQKRKGNARGDNDPEIDGDLGYVSWPEDSISEEELTIQVKHVIEASPGLEGRDHIKRHTASRP